MRIGVVSDTHDYLPNVRRIVRVLSGARIERVVHTGDITKVKTLRVLAELRVPIFGVYGNNDRERPELEEAALQLGFHFVDPPLTLEWAGRRIVVVHEPEVLEERGLAGCDLALHGHTHRHVDEMREGTLVFNPGECAGHMRGRNAVGIVDLVSLDTERLFF